MKDGLEAPPPLIYSATVFMSRGGLSWPRPRGTQPLHVTRVQGPGPAGAEPALSLCWNEPGVGRGQNPFAEAAADPLTGRCEKFRNVPPLGVGPVVLADRIEGRIVHQLRKRAP